jgi:hypothetical protein
MSSVNVDLPSSERVYAREFSPPFVQFLYDTWVRLSPETSECFHPFSGGGGASRSY